MTDMKESTLQVLEKNLENNKRELELYPPKREHIQGLRDKLVRRRETMNKMFPIIRDNLEKINPTVRFEEVPEYWQCQRELVTLDHEANDVKMQEQISQHDKELKQLDTEIKRLADEVPRLEKQIADMKGD